MEKEECDHSDYIKYGLYKTPNGIYQRYRCNKCFKTFIGEKIKEIEAE